MAQSMQGSSRTRAAKRRVAMPCSFPCGYPAPPPATPVNRPRGWESAPSTDLPGGTGGPQGIATTTLLLAPYGRHRVARVVHWRT